jgi:hypothetical protein
VASKAGWSDLDVRAVDTVRVLAADAVQKTGNGHPGTAMSLAPVAYLLYQNVMTHDPSDPAWLGRDRFVLSCGHSSLTQYIQLYLSGYGLELKDLEALRTWGSLTPGHPEVQAFVGGGAQPEFNQLDADFVRVIEDVIDTLIVKNVINITDLPDQAQAKLFARKSFRERVSKSSLQLFEPTDFGDVI